MSSHQGTFYLLVALGVGSSQSAAAHSWQHCPGSSPQQGGCGWAAQRLQGYTGMTRGKAGAQSKRCAPAPITLLLGRRGGWGMPPVFPEAGSPWAVLVTLGSASRSLLLNASVVKITCQMPRQGHRSVLKSSPEPRKWSIALPLLPFAEGPFQMGRQLLCAAVHQSQPDGRQTPYSPGRRGSAGTRGGGEEAAACTTKPAALSTTPGLPAPLGRGCCWVCSEEEP